MVTYTVNARLSWAPIRHVTESSVTQSQEFVKLGAIYQYLTIEIGDKLWVFKYPHNDMIYSYDYENWADMVRDVEPDEEYQSEMGELEFVPIYPKSIEYDWDGSEPK